MLCRVESVWSFCKFFVVSAASGSADATRTSPSGFLVEHKEVHTPTCKIGLEPAWLLGLSCLTRSAFLRGVSYTRAQNRPQSRTSAGFALSYTGDFALDRGRGGDGPALVIPSHGAGGN